MRDVGGGRLEVRREGDGKRKQLGVEEKEERRGGEEGEIWK
jgi:hypothetical protein